MQGSGTLVPAHKQISLDPSRIFGAGILMYEAWPAGILMYEVWPAGILMYEAWSTGSLMYEAWPTGRRKSLRMSMPTLLG